MSDICIRDNNEYFTIKPTHDRQFERPLSGVSLDGGGYTRFEGFLVT
jgi:hypothetical protein